MRIFMLLLLVLLLANPGINTYAQQRLPDLRVESRFVAPAGNSLAGLAEGQSGSGYLIYFLPELGIERPALVVRLSKQPGAAVAIAEVYDAPPGRDYVPVRIEGDQVTIDTETPPTVLITALDGWWVRGEQVNYNLNITVRGPVYAMWGAGDDGQYGWTSEIEPGQPAVAIEVRDPEGNGWPQWDLRSLLPDFGMRGYYRTSYAERRCDSPATIERGMLPEWPFVATEGGFQQPVGRLLPPIVVDWYSGRITHFKEIVTVRNQNCSYSVYSINPLQNDVINDLNFESPFAFYDLSGEGRGYPNLILRTERFSAGDPFSAGLDWEVLQGTPLSVPFQTIRYSWRNEVGDWLWDYKVEVLGFYPYSAETAIAGGEYRISAPRYEEYPAWVIERPWPVVTFVADEGGGYKSSEGIYDWSPRELGLAYLIGRSDTREEDAFSYIRAGFRGEYRFKDTQHLEVYLSPIDQRVHLLGSAGGMWNLDDHRAIELHNLDEDSYIDGWTRIVVPEHTDSDPDAEPLPLRGTIEEALYYLAGYLIYSGPQGAEVRLIDLAPSMVEGAPPHDQTSWLTTREQLDPELGRTRDPLNIRSWLNALGGTSVLKTDGTITDIRAVADGFRFVVDLQPNFTAPELTHATRLPPGRYLVRYDGRFSIEPLTPLISHTPGVTVKTQSLRQMDAARLQLELRNDGLEDLTDVTLELWASLPGQEPILLITRTVSLLAQVPETLNVEWYPTKGGEWRLEPRLVAPSGEITSFAPTTIVVAPADPVTSSRILAVSTLPLLLPFLGLGLTLAVTISIVVFVQQRRRSA